jgi:hypothetical protein
MPRKKNAVLEEIERRIASSDLLSDEDKEAARERAREHVAKARKEKALDAYFDAAVREEEREYEPADELVDFTVDLPDYTYMIAIDNVRYYHGCTYEIPKRKSDSMADIQARAWEHDREIQGRRRQGDMTRQPQHLSISPSNPNGRVTTTGNIRAPRGM